MQERRLVGLFAERKKLLDAHYADAVPLDLLKSKQERLTREIESAEGRLAEVEGDFRKAETNLKRALTRAGDCMAAYREASGSLRRQFNLVFFKRLLIDDEYTVTGELAEPFDTILGDQLRRAVAVKANEALQAAVKETIKRRAAEEQHPREPERPRVGAASGPGPSWSQGFSTEHLVRLVGQLSNPSTRLRIVLDAFPDGFPGQPPGPVVRQPVMRKLGNGVVQRAIVKALGAAERPMGLAEVQTAVESLVGQSVSLNSIKWCLSTGTRDKEPRFERVARGCYRLIRPT